MAESFFYCLGASLMQHRGDSIEVGTRRYKSCFGVSPKITSLLWREIKSTLPKKYKEEHLLWALYYLKNYPTESVARVFVKADEKTLREIIWTMIEKLSNINCVGLLSLNLYLI